MHMKNHAKVPSDAPVPSTLCFTAFWKQMFHSFCLMTSRRLVSTVVISKCPCSLQDPTHILKERASAAAFQFSDLCFENSIFLQTFFKLFIFLDWIQWAFILKINKPLKLYINRHNHPDSSRLAVSQWPNMNCNPFAESPLETGGHHFPALSIITFHTTV